MIRKQNYCSEEEIVYLYLCPDIADYKQMSIKASGYCALLAWRLCVILLGSDLIGLYSKFVQQEFASAKIGR
jgi:hypothetical protein